MKDAKPLTFSQYGTCWQCGNELPCTSSVNRGHHRTICTECGAWSNYSDRSELPGYRAEVTTKQEEGRKV